MLRGHSLQLAQVALVVFPCFFLFGYNQVDVGGLLSYQSWTEAFPQIDTIHATDATESHRSVIQGVYVSSFTLGGAVGSLSCSLMGDVLGRRKTIFLGAILTLVGELISCTSFHLPQLLVGRIVTGLGVGVLSTMVPVWQSECSPAVNRGKHVVIDGIFITSGYAVSQWVNYGFSYIDQHSVSWRVPLAIPCVTSLILLSSIFFFPESPRWLVRVGRGEQAAQILGRVKDKDPESAEIRQEVAGIEFSLEETARNAASIKDIFTMKDGKLFYRFMLCIGLQFWIQMTGANVISTYSTTIFQQNLGLSSGLSRILSGSALTWKFLASFVAFFTIDRFGRRKLFLFCGTGITLCMMSMAITSSFSSNNHGAAIGSAFFLFLFNFFFPIGFLGPSFLYCTEVAPIRLRVAMTSISTANHWLWNFLVQMVTPIALSEVGFKYYILYTLIGITFPTTVYFMYPETMGQSLEKLEDLFQQDLSVFETVRMANKLAKMPVSEGVAEDLKAQMEQIEDTKAV
ncbi:hypothetical protein ASPWEDRAFT_55429 [Aspergillus wentii DTO 134E9]|uniref:Major facilitator superfamily (MFS) profile domain-containing protein n=1 Tax=Aspergillus wentii DTO 134E9 TaxID=1073089 RepID=A0A1L9R4U8_ASPWE|nr:uncharacterized protein ASPWEDRAFT_55429 [Aspergillus wentii DTO 134E9]OJJ29907.1 hypothetical protein ASPWEDRAFT_55429 [Aspergillus wentii DTO 134E9]